LEPDKELRMSIVRSCESAGSVGRLASLFTYFRSIVLRYSLILVRVVKEFKLKSVAVFNGFS
jgi:hypothetical protein